MRSLRLILVLVLAASVAVLPVSVGAAAAHATKAQIGMGATGQDWPCCDGAQQAASNFCMLKCFGVAAITVERSTVEDVVPWTFPVIAVASPTPFSPGLDPRPPRIS
jgi:hypothetical protein